MKRTPTTSAIVTYFFDGDTDVRRARARTVNITV